MGAARMKSITEGGKLEFKRDCRQCSRARYAHAKTQSIFTRKGLFSFVLCSSMACFMAKPTVRFRLRTSSKHWHGRCERNGTRERDRERKSVCVCVCMCVIGVRMCASQYDTHTHIHTYIHTHTDAGKGAHTLKKWQRAMSRRRSYEMYAKMSSFALCRWSVCIFMYIYIYAFVCARIVGLLFSQHSDIQARGAIRAVIVCMRKRTALLERTVKNEMLLMNTNSTTSPVCISTVLCIVRD
jgi:hypothetical protein